MKTKISFFLFSAVFLFSCSKDWIENDLAGKTITILAPANNDTVNTTTPLFWWNTLNDARRYRLQIAYPSFAATQSLVYDTAVDGDRFYPALQPGITYQWRIRPENGSSHGDWIQRTITIDSTVSLVNQQIIFSTPSNNYSTNQSNLAITWNTINGAAFYRVTVTNTASGATAADFTTTSPLYSATLAEGHYKIRVRAESSSSFTSYDSLYFAFDFTGPSAPSLSQPADNSTVNAGTLNFIWAHAADAVRDSFYLSTDSTFSTASLIGLSTSNPNYSWNSASSGNTYWWQVRSFDAAGNCSTYSKRKFIVN